MAPRSLLTDGNRKNLSLVYAGRPSLTSPQIAEKISNQNVYPHTSFSCRSNIEKSRKPLTLQCPLRFSGSFTVKQITGIEPMYKSAKFIVNTAFICFRDKFYDKFYLNHYYILFALFFSSCYNIFTVWAVLTPPVLLCVGAVYSAPFFLSPVMYSIHSTISSLVCPCALSHSMRRFTVTFSISSICSPFSLSGYYQALFLLIILLYHIFV